MLPVELLADVCLGFCQSGLCLLQASPRGALRHKLHREARLRSLGVSQSAALLSLQPLPAPFQPCWAPPQCMQHVRSCVQSCTTAMLLGAHSCAWLVMQ